MKIFYVLLYFVSVESAKKLPSYVEQCYRYPSEELSQCVKRNINNLRSKIRDGLPELAIPPLNPLFLHALATLEPNPDFRCELKDINLWNMENINVKKFEMELIKVKKWVTDIEYPYLALKFGYAMTGKLLVLKLDSSGTGYGNVTGVTMRAEADLTTYVKKNGKEHLSVKDMIVKINTTSGSFHFDNLFKGKEELNEGANRIINENFQVFVEEFIPLVENIIKSFLKQFFNNLYSKYPIDVLFPNKL